MRNLRKPAPRTVDLSKLTAAPWEWWTSNSFRRLSGGGKDGSVLCPTVHASDGHGDILVSDADAEFICLARGAFDVMMRRGLSPERYVLLGGGFAWRIPMSQANEMIRLHGANATDFKRFVSLAKSADPFTVILEADKWLTERGL